MPEVNNSKPKPDPLMSRLYNRSADIKATTHSPVRSPRVLSQVPLCHVTPTPSSQTLIPKFPCEEKIAHCAAGFITPSISVQRSSPNDATMRPVKPPNYSAVRLHQSALVARCSPVPDRKSGDEAYQEELHSPTFPQVLGLCQMNAVHPPLSS